MLSAMSCAEASSLGWMVFSEPGIIRLSDSLGLGRLVLTPGIENSSRTKKRYSSITPAKRTFVRSAGKTPGAGASGCTPDDSRR